MAGTGPTLAGFQAFITNVMGVESDQMPSTGVIQMALAVALAIVNPALQAVPIPTTDSADVTISSGGTIYNLAVYNLAASNLLAYAQDPEGAPDVPGSQPPLPYFAYARKQWAVNSFISGVISGSADETTSQTLVVQDAAKNFTLANLQQLKDPYGRQYLAFAQSYGPETWGMT